MSLSETPHARRPGAGSLAGAAPAPPARPGRDRTALLPLVAGAPVLALLVWWAFDEGGYEAQVWMPGGVAVLALTALVLALAGPQVRAPSRTATVALAAFGGYVVWSFLSIAWAGAPGPALEGSLRTLLLFALFALPCLLPWTAGAATTALAAFSGVVAVVGAVTLLRAAGADEPYDFLISFRLSEPLGYPNAAAALWTMAALPGIALAARPSTPVVVRPLLLAGATLLLGLAVLAQSRGWLYTLPAVGIAALVLVPGRLRLVLFTVPVAAAVWLTAPTLLAVYDIGAGRPGSEVVEPIRAALDATTRALGLATLVTLAAGTALVALERAWPRRLRVRTPVPSRRAGLAVAAIALAGLVATGIAVSGPVADRVDRAFEQGGLGDESEEGRLGQGLGSNRYDLWRAGVAAWRERPVGGLGQDNYAHEYLRFRGNGIEEPRWVHSLPLRLLVHTGVVGAVLFVAFLLAVAVGALRGPPGRREEPGDEARFAALAALLPLAVWVLHGSVDWLWEMPVLSGAALAFAGVALAVGRMRARVPRVPSPGIVADAPHPGRRRRARALRTAGAAVCVLGALALVPPYVSQRDVEAAARDWPGDPSAAFARLERSRALNPLTARPDLVEGVIARRMGRPEAARAAFRRAAEREPQAWFAQFQLALLATEAGDRKAARDRLRAAQRRNPREELLGIALERLPGPRPLRAREAERLLQRRIERRLGR